MTKLKPFQPYTIDDDGHSHGYTIVMPTESDAKVQRGGMTGKYIGFTGWQFYPSHAGGPAAEHSKYGLQSLEFEYEEDIYKYNYDINDSELVNNSQKQDMITEIFEYYKNKGK